MGKILECVVLLSSLSLTLGSQQYPRTSQSINYERENRENFTHVIKQFQSDRNDIFNKKVLPLQNSQSHRKPNQMLTSLGLHTYAVEDDLEWNGKKKNSSEKIFRFSDLPKRNFPEFSQRLHFQRNGRNFYSEYYPSQKLSRLNNYNSQNKQIGYNSQSNPKSYNQKSSNTHSIQNIQNSYNGKTTFGNHNNPNIYRKSHDNENNYSIHNNSNYKNNQYAESQIKQTDTFSRRYHSQSRIPRYHQKICDPCNSVPWVPLLKVPDSYRQQRTHITELHPTPHQSFNFDFHSYSTNTHNVLLPPVPLAPPVFDTTISSSFGLPIGNIPTSHGLLAPIASEITNYAIDYNNPFNYYSPPSLLETNNFPELSPVPVVPIHDSGQFVHLDTTIPDLVPPTKPIDVSKVVLTISEDKPTDLRPPNHRYPTGDLTPESTGASNNLHTKQQHSQDFGKLEIVKSIPIAEFTSSVNIQQEQQELPLYPPLQSEYPNEFQVPESSQHSASGSDFLVPPVKNNANDFHISQHSDHSSSASNFLVPPVKNQVSFTSNESSDSKTEYQGEASAPKPLTSPSLSWLFSDHTSPPADSKSTVSVTNFMTDTQEIASVVNNELRPVSSPKSKKIQIIIPYTTKSKTEHDSSAFESVQREVYQSPANRTSTKVKDNADDQDSSHKYFNEMQHIIAKNLRELLRGEIEKSQNYPLQNNIDNWTALEYSNHKTVESKAPKDVIAQALAVTSIPGTSISHLLLPSKKIPKEYFATTPIPVYDEPNSPVYKTENSTVHSRPFTAKPYATTNIYNSLATNTTRSSKETFQINHETNYTEIEKERVNTWKRINENLVLPEARTRTTAPAVGWSNSRYLSSLRTDKVQIVTPVSVTSPKNQTVTPTVRRTTRQTHTTPAPTAKTRKPLFLNRMNSTKLEKVSNQTSPFNRKFTHNSTTTTTTTTTTTLATSTTSSSRYITTAVVTDSDIVSNATTKEEPNESSRKEEPISINDIFPFRNQELPWESKQNGSQPGVRVGRQRKSLIKQANLQKSKAAVTSS